MTWRGADIKIGVVKYGVLGREVYRQLVARICGYPFEHEITFLIAKNGQVKIGFRVVFQRRDVDACAFQRYPDIIADPTGQSERIGAVGKNDVEFEEWLLW